MANCYVYFYNNKKEIRSELSMWFFFTQLLFTVSILNKQEMKYSFAFYNNMGSLDHETVQNHTKMF